jgi:hypothetical protein
VDILAELDAKIAYHEDALAKLRGFRATAVELLAALGEPALPPAPSLNGHAREKRPGKPAPRPAPAASGPRRSRDPDRALRVARLLLDGPMGTGSVEVRAKVSCPTALATLRGRPDWFRKADPANQQSPWELTEAGRLAATAPTATSGAEAPSPPSSSS